MQNHVVLPSNSARNGWNRGTKCVSAATDNTIRFSATYDCLRTLGTCRASLIYTTVCTWCGIVVCRDTSYKMQNHVVLPSNSARNGWNRGTKCVSAATDNTIRFSATYDCLRTLGTCRASLIYTTVCTWCGIVVCRDVNRMIFTELGKVRRYFIH